MYSPVAESALLEIKLFLSSERNKFFNSRSVASKIFKIHGKRTMGDFFLFKKKSAPALIYRFLQKGHICVTGQTLLIFKEAIY
jgi:hypothetical protein